MSEAKRYRAFISYSHADETWAKWLHRGLESYVVPARLRRASGGTLPRRLIPVFRDRDELPSASELGSVIEAALRESAALVVVCSPRAAQSRWVNEEIRYFKSLGEGGKVLALIVDGEPHGGDARECFPPALRFALARDGTLGPEPTEPIAADAREGREGKRDALLKLIAGLLGVGFDDLRQRERQRRFWQRAQQLAASLAVVLAVVAAWQWFERYEDARRLELAVESAYEQGRTALLDQQFAKATAQLGQAWQLGRDTPALRFMLKRALESVESVHPLPKAPVVGVVRRPAFSPDDAQWLLPVIGQETTTAMVMRRDGAGTQQFLQGLPRIPHISRYVAEGQRVLVSGFEESTAYAQSGATTGLWDRDSGTRLLTLPGHAGHFGDPLTADGRLLLTADEKGFAGVHIRDATTGGVLRALPHAAQARAASFSPDGRWVLSGDQLGVVRQWDAASGRLLRVLPDQTPTPITGIVIVPDGSRAVAISKKGDVRVWSLADGLLQLAFAADKSFVADLRLDAAGKHLLTIGRQGYKVWDLERGALLFARDIELGWEASGDLDASGSFVAVATTDNPYSEVWDIASRRRIAVLQFEPAAVTAALFDHAGGTLLLGGETGGQALVTPLPGPALQLAQPPSVYGARFSPDGREIATVGKDQMLRVWDSASGAALAVGSGHAKRIVELAYSPDGSRIATGADDGMLKIWRAGDGQLLASSLAHQAGGRGIYRLEQSADGAQVMTIPTWQQGEDFTAKLWAADDARLLQILVHPAAIHDAAFSADGRQLATAGADGVLRVWDCGSGKLLHAFALSKSVLLAVAWLPDGRSLITADNDRLALRIDAATGSVVEQFTVGTRDDAPSVIAVSKDGRQWAMATELGHIWVRDTLPESGWRQLAGGGQRLIRLRYLDAGLLLSAGYDGTIRVWDSGDRAEEIAVIGGHDNAPWSLDVDPAGQRLVSAGLDGLVRVWRVDSKLPVDREALRRVLCALPLSAQTGAQQFAAAPACP